MKSCTRCEAQKAFVEFRKNPKMLCGYDSWCLACVSEHKSAVRQRVKSEAKPLLTTKLCGDCQDELSAAEFSMERGRKDGLSRICRGCRSKKHSAHYAKDPVAWRAKAAAGHRRRANNPSFITHKRVSARMGEWLGTVKGGRKCFDLLGYELPELRAHLERQFTNGMSWENMGEWHIDHIVPLSSFSVSGPDDPELRRAWGLPNLRPMWAKDNMRKSARRETLL